MNGNTENLAVISYKILTEEFGGIKYGEISQKDIEDYAAQLPSGLTQIWQRWGLTSHGDGEFWFINPNSYLHVLKDFFGDTGTIPFARHSFGRIYFFKGECIYSLLPQISRATKIGKKRDIDAFISMNAIDTSSNRHKSHVKALKKFGPIQSDEMYGYFPMLALGGNGSLKETQIVKTQEYLHLVAKVASEAIRNGWDPLGLSEE